ncbi:MAG: purine nucleoside phosphorylase DeoD-type [Mycoplasmataceae bacterium]|jgi:purine-nucleoside phosphorylase|nr:purine nucleoside phosphorylase DeoD-type [Mycoplasmataceae bacterium]
MEKTDKSTTPHNVAPIGEIAPVVLFVGDPHRATLIANNVLTDAKLISDVRGMVVYTGTYENEKITVMSHGMGIPSIGIYSYELYTIYNVQVIIRVGTCGSYSKDLKLGDIYVANESFSESSYAEYSGVACPDHVIEGSQELLSDLKSIMGDTKLKIGRVHTTDVFYSPDPPEKLLELTKGAVAVEMETYGLYVNAKRCGKKAIGFFTVTDSIIEKLHMPSHDRVSSVNEMLLLGTKLACYESKKINKVV